MNNDCNHNKCQCGSCKCGISLKSIPAVLGDDTGEFKPENGAYFNTFVKYEANGAQYFYSKDGIFSKVAEMPEYVKQQSDWDETDESSPAFIKNKPEIGDVSHLVEMIEAEATTRAEQDEFLHNENVALGNELNAETNARTQKDTQLENAINSKADQSALAEEVANRTSEDATLSARIDALSGLEYEVVQQLPTTGRKGVIYLVPQDRQAPDIYDEYLWINTAFERIGSTAVDLTDYVKNTDYATGNTAGVVKTDTTLGSQTSSNGTLRANPRTYEQYQAGSEYTFIGKGTLENVIAGKGLVSNTDYATDATAGVVREANCFLASSDNGGAYAEEMSYDTYNEASDYNFIGKGTLENVIEGKGLVSNTTYASTTNTGVVKASSTYAVAVSPSNGNIYTTERTYAQYVDANQGMFIGKATLENVIAGKGLLDSSALTDYVKNTDIATGSKPGIVMTNATSYGLQTASSGNLQTVTKTYDQYTTVSNACFIGKGTLENVITGKGLVASEEAQKLKVLTQSEYDALTPADDTIYFIKEA